MAVRLSVACGFSCEQGDMCEERRGGGAGKGGLELLCEPPASAEPSESSFHHPAPRQAFEHAGCVGALDALFGPFADFGESSVEFGTGIATVGKRMPQPGIQGFDGFEDVGHPILVPNTGMMNDGTDKVADCIRDDVALGFLDFLSGVEPTRPAGFGGLGRLAVDHTGCGRSLASSYSPCQHGQHVIDPIERAIATDAVKMPLHGGERCEFLRDPPSLAAGQQHVDDDRHNPSQRHSLGPASMRRRRHERFDQGPFGIGEVACLRSAPPSGDIAAGRF